MFRNLYLTVTFLVMIIGSGCATSPGYFYVNNNRFDSPEAIGKAAKIEVMGSYQSDSPIIVDLNASQDPPGSAGAAVLEAPNVFEDLYRQYDPTSNLVSHLYLDLRMGLGERFDIGADFSAGELPSHIKIKYQFLGATQMEAKKENVSGSVVLGFSYGSREIDNEPDIFGNIYDGALDYFGISASIVLGRRITDNMLLYFNQTATLYYADLDLQRNLVATGLSPYQYSSNGHQLLSLFGAKLFFNESQSFFVGAEAGVVSLDWENAKADSEFTFGLMSGMGF